MRSSVTEVIVFAWRIFLARPWFFASLILILLGISLASGILQSVSTSLLGKELGGAISFFIALILDMFIGMGIVSVALTAHDSVMSPTLVQLWNPTPFWRYLGMVLIVLVLYFVIIFSTVLIAWLFFSLVFVPYGLAGSGDLFSFSILPWSIGVGELIAFLVMLPCTFAPFLIIDKGYAPLRALTESARLLKGNRRWMLRLVCALIVVTILGLLALGVGLFVAIPVSLLAMTHAYKELAGRDHPLKTDSVLNLTTTAS